MKTYWKLLLLCTVAVGATSCGTCDEELVLQKVNDLFLETDNRNWPAVQAIFDDSVVFDVTSMAGGKPQNLTPSDITGAWDQGLKKLKAIHHQTGNFRVKVTGNEATVFCYGTAHHYLPTKSRRNKSKPWRTKERYCISCARPKVRWPRLLPKRRSVC